MANYNTKSKDYIINYMKDSADRNFSANEIYQHLQEHNQNMNRSTLYRNLDKLVDAGTLMRIKIAGEDSCRYQYQRPEGHCDEHIHMQCRSCGTVFHLECGFMSEISKHLQNHHGFLLEGEGSMLSGLCKECRKIG